MPAVGRRRAALSGLREACGVPGLILGASFLGFGSLVASSHLPLWAGLVSSLGIWALPGQIALVETYALGATLVVSTVAVALTNARLLPMTVVLMPWLSRPGMPRWKLYVAAHFIAVTSWAVSMRRLPQIAEPIRLAWFLGFAGGLWAISFGATLLGFHLAGVVPRPVNLALVFLNPLYFLLLLGGDLSQRPRTFAIALGAVLGPLFHLLDADWGLLMTGLVAGTAAFLITRGKPPNPSSPSAQVSDA